MLENCIVDCDWEIDMIMDQHTRYNFIFEGSLYMLVFLLYNWLSILYFLFAVLINTALSYLVELINYFLILTLLLQIFQFRLFLNSMHSLLFLNDNINKRTIFKFKRQLKQPSLFFQLPLRSQFQNMRKIIILKPKRQSLNNPKR